MAPVYGTPAASCPKCGVAMAEAHPYGWCIACGDELPADVVANNPQLQAKLAEQSAARAAPIPPSSRKTYPAIRTLAGAYRVFAYLVLCFGVLKCIITGVQADDLLAALPALFYTAFAFVVLLAGGELLALMPDLADRAEQTNTLLREIKELLLKKT